MKKIGRDCQEVDCEKTVKDGPLYRINPKGVRGVFMCKEHAAEILEIEALIG